MRFICDYLMNTIIFSEMTKDWFNRRMISLAGFSHSLS